MKILGIETSCDETAASIIEGNRGKINVLSNVVSSQIDLHKKYGGIVGVEKTKILEIKDIK